MLHQFRTMVCGRQNNEEDNMRYTGPKNRRARREGIDLEFKTPGSKSHSNLLRRLNIPPGQHGTSRFRKLTEYGTQLREKQKIRHLYGLTESQLKKYFQSASRSRGNTAEFLVHKLESRLDNVIYRLGLTPTRQAARQLVGHGHMTVNSKKVTIPSFQVSINDTIEFKKEKTTKIPYIDSMLKKKDAILPDWLEKKATKGKIVGLPGKDNFTSDVNLQSVIEFYSR